MVLERVEIFLQLPEGFIFEGERCPAYTGFHYGFHICPFLIFSIVLTISPHAESISWSWARPLSVME